MTDCNCDHFTTNVVFDGSVAIGTPSPGFRLHVEHPDGVASGEHIIAVFRRDSSGGGVVATYQADGTSVTASRVRSSGATDLRIGTGGRLDAMTILNSNGNVGVGRTDPSAPLHVYGNTTSQAQVISEAGSGASAAIELKDGAATPNRWWVMSGAVTTTDGKFDIFDRRQSAHRLVIDTAGNVGIARTDPSEKLDVNGNIKASGNVVASNNIKLWDSGWQAVSALQVLTLNHSLGAFPKFVSVWCAQSVNPSSPTLASPFFVDSKGNNGDSTGTTGQHTHGTQSPDGNHNHAIPERGAYVGPCDSSTIKVRAGNYIGINEAGSGWLTSGYYRVYAWA
ncbi:MAG: hypothetical protein M1370_11890 [Bacteroidetes bacterium]|nr:hypothetical protein [Bacteroidota bacterium]